MYTTAQLIIDGALDEDFESDDNDGFKSFNRWMDGVKEDRKNPRYAGQRWQVFRIVHEHDSNVDECMCVQMLNDHDPYWVSEGK